MAHNYDYAADAVEAGLLDLNSNRESDYNFLDFA
jgi:hypothetical protein